MNEIQQENREKMVGFCVHNNFENTCKICKSEQPKKIMEQLQWLGYISSNKSKFESPLTSLKERLSAPPLREQIARGIIDIHKTEEQGNVNTKEHAESVEIQSRGLVDLSVRLEGILGRKIGPNELSKNEKLQAGLQLVMEDQKKLAEQKKEIIERYPEIASKIVEEAVNDLLKDTALGDKNRMPRIAFNFDESDFEKLSWVQKNEIPSEMSHKKGLVAEIVSLASRDELEKIKERVRTWLAENQKYQDAPGVRDFFKKIDQAFISKDQHEGEKLGLAA